MILVAFFLIVLITLFLMFIGATVGVLYYILAGIFNWVRSFGK